MTYSYLIPFIYKAFFLKKKPALGPKSYKELDLSRDVYSTVYDFPIDACENVMAPL